MKAVAFRQSLPVSEADCLEDMEVPEPAPGPRDLLVRVRAVAVNPVDTKLRRNTDPGGEPCILGFDAAGEVLAVGSEVERFAVGDEVYYAGAVDRPGSNAQRQAVDERIVGHKPRSLSWSEAAALPLTSITAWELLFDCLAYPVGRFSGGGHLLVVGGAGGVGSMAIQLARRLTGLKVLATASRPESREWVQALGAHHVVDHREDLVSQVRERAHEGVDAVLSLTSTDQHFPVYHELLRPRGRIAVIDDPAQPLDILSLKRKSISLHWELMFTRSLYETEDMEQQGRLLDEVAEMVDRGLLGTTARTHLGVMNARNLRRAHEWQEQGTVIGKQVLDGFPD